ncbi:hypothetical protein [Rhodopirellula sp. MGV]|uniref:hypothetical protein n=1 Tax=Rhodopirellula sp. MGV TaxID=2023130 RepID=UPI000B9625D5|nr:hypothetical protein [Rhodopirellula sp. MGV]OYP29465.1 hypothetical protein CGZ80_25035 [Rhodopirellula sp. MGV]PNY35820.1 hypothetical protein C2E31_16195 [Rhodopirellula baltica]
MKKLALACVAIASLSVTSVGCGGHTEAVTKPPENAVPTSELPSQSGYEAAMKNSGSRPGN